MRLRPICSRFDWRCIAGLLEPSEISMSQPREEWVACDLCGADDSAVVLEKDGGTYVSCRHCGLVYTNPRPVDFAAQNEESFTNTLNQYIAKCYHPVKQRQYRRELRRFAPYRRNNRLLEIGCNVGGLLYQAREQGWTAVGVEPAAACAQYGREQHGLEVLPTTLEAAALPADSFDAVYANAVFEHLASPRRVLQEIQRVLRPGGVVYLDTVNYDSYTRQRLGGDWKLLQPRGHLSLFNPVTLRRFCEQAGLRVLAITTHGVRLRPNKSRPLRGWRRWREEAMKLPLSVACRFTLKGDSISVLGQKPPAEPGAV